MGGNRKRKGAEGLEIGASTALVLGPSGPANRLRLEAESFSRLARCGSSAQVYGMQSAFGFPTVVNCRKERKLLQASSARAETAKGSKRTLSDLTDKCASSYTDKCHDLLTKKGRVVARQRATGIRAAPVTALVALPAAGTGPQLAIEQGRTEDRSLVVVARQSAAGVTPQQSSAEADGRQVPEVPNPPARNPKVCDLGASASQPCTVTRGDRRPASLPGDSPADSSRNGHFRSPAVVLGAGNVDTPPAPEPDPPERGRAPPTKAPPADAGGAGAGSPRGGVGRRNGNRRGNGSRRGHTQGAGSPAQAAGPPGSRATAVQAPSAAAASVPHADSQDKRRGNGGLRGQAPGTAAGRQAAAAQGARAAVNPPAGAAAAPLQQHADPEARAQARGRVSQSVPAAAHADWARASVRSLEDMVDAANHALGVAAAARLDGALEALAALPVRILADNGSSRSRPRRILARLQRISEGQLLADEEDEEQGPAASGSRRRRVPDQVNLAGRIERHASRGSIRRAAAALDAAPLADTSDPAVIAKLRALHPEAAAPAALETDVPAIQISEETLVAVEKRLSANSRGTAGGVTGWTYEQALVPVRVSSEGRRAVLQFVNLILSGKLPRSCFLLESLLVGLEKTKDGVPTGDVRPIAIGEVWYRLAMICALVQKGHEVGVALGLSLIHISEPTRPY